MIPLPAHLGPWLAELLYVLPLLGRVVWISLRAILDRRAERREPPERSPTTSG